VRISSAEFYCRREQVNNNNNNNNNKTKSRRRQHCQHLNLNWKHISFLFLFLIVSFLCAVTAVLCTIHFKFLIDWLIELLTAKSVVLGIGPISTNQELADAAAYAPGRRFTYAHTIWQHFLRQMTSWPSSWKCDVKSLIRLRQSIRIYLYLKNFCAKFHPGPIWSDGALGYFEEVAPTRTRTTRTTRWEMISLIWNQFLIQHI